MKKIFLSVLVTTVLVIVTVNSQSQILGNAYLEKNILSNSSDYSQSSRSVDLNIQSYSSNFSNLLEANVMINVKANSYVAIFSLTQYGKTIEEVEAAMSARSEIFKTNLQKEGMDEKQIFFDPITMVPTYETEVTEKKLSRTFNEVPTGFEMKRNIHLTFYKQEQINPIITVAAKAEVYDLVKVDYNIENKDEILSMLRQEALKILLDKKAVLEKAGIFTKFTQVGEMHSSAYPSERYAEYYAFRSGIAPTFMNNSKKDKPIQVSYNYAEKNKTIYYDKVSVKQFDKVINPVVNEPMVQVYLTLKGQYQIVDPEAAILKNTYDEKVRNFQLRSMELDLDAKKRDIELKGKVMPVVEIVKKKN